MDYQKPDRNTIKQICVSIVAYSKCGGGTNLGDNDAVVPPHEGLQEILS